MNGTSDIQTEAPATTSPTRLISLDAFRGTIMLLMASAGLGVSEIAKNFPHDRGWKFLGYHTDHAAWSGCTLWDLIQPAFMFMVGVALPWSVANRRGRGQSFGKMFGHALLRSLLLILLAVFLSSAWSNHTQWVFANVLAQIGLGFPILFLLAFVGPRTLWATAFGLLLAYWLAFVLYPLPPDNFNWEAVGVGVEWTKLNGFAAHWEKNTNFAAAFDVWFLNLFPRAQPFIYNAGGYQTLNFVPSLATMIFGLLAGRLLRSENPIGKKVLLLICVGTAGIILGKALDLALICPMVKRIWTPSFAIYSAGWVTLMLAAFVVIIDWAGYRRWAFPMIVAGLNPITLYCLWQLSGGFIRHQLEIHAGPDIFAICGETWNPLLERGTVLFVLWLIVWWMYRQKIFVRI